MAHTPGPWRFLMEEDGDEETDGHAVGCWNGDIIAGPGGVAYEEICDVWPRDEANGHLIAAAPDLLAALENLLANVRSDTKLWDAEAQARAALAKAKGGDV